MKRMEGSLPDPAIIVLTNLPDRETAQTLARALVGGRLAACVNVGAAVESMYHWHGQIETGTEIPVAIKTRALLYAKVEAEIRRIHPYELPEVVAVPITDGFAPYLDWIRAQTA
jgi:periplasmic divalent cation tolerance protein